MVSAVRPTSPSPWHCTFSCNTGPPQDRVNDSYNYILNNLINDLAEESNNNKDDENIIDKNKTKNYSDGSNDSGNINNNNSKDSDSSSSDKDNKAHRCVGR